MVNPFINFESILKEVSPNKLIAVSKNQSSADISLMYSLGITEFAENHVQILVQRQQEFPYLKWHFIGQLQRNKVKYLVGKTVLIQSLDSEELAAEIQKQAAKLQVKVNCLIQLKFDSDKQRGGVPINRLPELWDYCCNCNFIAIKGFMVVAPQVVATQLELIFLKAKEIYDNSKALSSDICYLSMGMSADYKLALQCGSNMVRIGERLFTKG